MYVALTLLLNVLGFVLLAVLVPVGMWWVRDPRDAAVSPAIVAAAREAVDGLLAGRPDGPPVRS